MAKGNATARIAKLFRNQNERFAYETNAQCCMNFWWARGFSGAIKVVAS